MKYAVAGLNKLSAQIMLWRSIKGFHTPKDLSDLDAMLAKLMLVVTELSEASEAVRHKDELNFKEEIADTFIRLLDIAGSYRGFDLETEIQNKMLVNEGRPQLHGKEC
jgi:NTP pyrophosphatase (non-canonical NTP hydrolase)